ncbi:MAG: hypothetical protein FWF79_06070 [Defluviitaleaceae bacterium]|nr:hypothetical protein [Defluviitaleaceae bacterium]
MFLSLISGLVVSVDAFFIGLSLGLQKKCRFLYLAVINTVLLGLCIAGYFLAGQIYESIPFDPDIIVGFAFITLGLWTILQFYFSKHIRACCQANSNHPPEGGDSNQISISRISLVGLVMSGEAMLITMGITMIFLPHSTLIIPITVALAHFGYSVLSFYLARTKHIKRLPSALSHTISGVALIIYGLLALLIEFGIYPNTL